MSPDRPVSPATHPPFSPPLLFRNGHAQTIGAAFLPAVVPPDMRAPEVHEVRVAPGSAVRLFLHRRPGAARGLVVLLHGLAGAADSPVVMRTAVEAWSRGWSVARWSFRNCGGTAPIASTLYNAGMSGDLAEVLASDPLQGLGGPIVGIGHSLGGNILLKYLGEAAPRRPGEERIRLPWREADAALTTCTDGPGRAGRCLPHLGRGSRLSAAVAICPPVDLEATEINLRRARNIFYQLSFVRKLVSAARGRYRLQRSGPRPSMLRTPTLHSFDAAHTAPDAGYSSPEEYYRASSSIYLLPRIDVPTLVLAGIDDPLVPAEMFTSVLSLNESLSWVLSEHGGHCGWIERRDGRLVSLAPRIAMDFLERVTPAA